MKNSLSDKTELPRSSLQLPSDSETRVLPYHLTSKEDSNALSSILTLTDWLVLSFIRGVGPARLDRLKTYIDTLLEPEIRSKMSGQSELPLSSFELDKDLLIRLKWPVNAAIEAAAYLTEGVITDAIKTKIEDTKVWLQDENHYLVSKDDDLYPAELKHIPVAPMLLYIEGQIDTLLRPKIGIVGARKCSAYGRDSAFYYSNLLSQHGISVVSGGALGIDSAAHMGAISANVPTIAIMGAGLKNLYPKMNIALYRDLIDQGGVLISEYPLNTPVKAHLFPPRNRIISGLSLGVFIVEASLKSGSLITAHYAVQHNREVFALPGRTTDKQSVGTHYLIQQGAKLITCVEDILVELPLTTCLTNQATSIEKGETQNVSREISKKQSKIAANTLANDKSDNNCLIKWDEMGLLEPCLSVITHMDALLAKDLGKKTFEFDELIDGVSISSSELSQALIELEMLGLTEAIESGGYQRCYEKSDCEKERSGKRMNVSQQH